MPVAIPAVSSVLFLTAAALYSVALVGRERSRRGAGETAATRRAFAVLMISGASLCLVAAALSCIGLVLLLAARATQH